MKTEYFLPGTATPGTIAERSSFANLSSLLPLLLLLALPGLAQAQFEYTITSGTVSITRYLGIGGHVIIPEAIDGLPVRSIGAKAFEANPSVTGITIPDGIKSIGESVFRQCTGLTRVTIGNSVLSIADGAFEGCRSLTRVTIPNSVTRIGGRAFSDCTSLTAVTIGNSVSSIGWYAFAGCTCLPSIAIPNSVTRIESSAFADCDSLTNVTMGNGINNMGEWIFSNCSSLTSVAIPLGVQRIPDHAFSGCTQLNTLLIPDSVISIGYAAFFECTSLTVVTIPDSVTSIGEWAFCGCAALNSITISYRVSSIGSGALGGCTSLSAINVDSLNPVFSSLEGVLFNRSQTTLIQCPGGMAGNYTIPSRVSSIGVAAFDGCTRLTSVTIPEGITSISVRDCTSLTSITIPDSVTSFSVQGCVSLKAIWVSPLHPAYSSVDGVLFDKNQMTLIQWPWGKATEYAIPDGVMNIGVGAFVYCTTLASVTIPDSVTNIGGNAFLGCSGLTNVTLPNSVTSIGGSAFAGCTGLTSLTIPDSATSIDWFAFASCGGLTDVTIGNSVSRIEAFTFEFCTNLISVTIPHSVTNIGSYAFWYCSNLTSVMIPENVTNLYDGWFFGCDSLREITVDPQNTAYASVGGVLFDKAVNTLIQCTAGREGEITIPGSVTSIGNMALSGCAALKRITVDASNPVYSSVDGVLFNRDQTILIRCPRGRSGNYVLPRSVTSIDWEGFTDCTGLTSVTIGDRVANIEYAVFLGCNALTAVYFEGNAPLLGSGVFESTTAIIFYRPETAGWGPMFGGRPTLPWSTVRGDVDGDVDVDRDDLAVLIAARNSAALGPEDTRDLDGDGMITVLDARTLVTLFAVPGGFTRVEPGSQGIALEWSAGNGPMKLQSTSDLRSGLWEDVGGLQSSTNAVVGSTAERMFFRLVLPE